jgi:hypothetical protein
MPKPDEDGTDGLEEEPMEPPLIPPPLETLPPDSDPPPPRLTAEPPLDSPPPRAEAVPLDSAPPDGRELPPPPFSCANAGRTLRAKAAATALIVN